MRPAKRPRALKAKVRVTPKAAPAWCVLFLAELRQTCNVRLSCDSAGINRQYAYKRRGTDAEFCAQWDDAIEDAVDALEDVARKRALETSDFLLWKLLCAHRPRKFGNQAAPGEGTAMAITVTRTSDAPNRE